MSRIGSDADNSTSFYDDVRMLIDAIHRVNDAAGGNDESTHIGNPGG